MNRSDLGDLLYFLAIARHGNFRKAGIELGVTASALSHAMKGFENRLGVRLLNRTARSVTLTAAGDTLEGGSIGALAAIGEAFESLNRFRDRPGGKIRINAVVDAAALLLGPILAQMGERYPEIEVDIVASNRMVDVVAEGFDAGVRYGGTVPEDMIAQRLTSDLRWIVVASPGYLARYGTPLQPNDLQSHRCLGVRLGDDRVYDREFLGPVGEFSVAVQSAIVANDSRATLAVALQDGGLTFGLEPVFAPHLKDGTLVQVLGAFAISGPGFHLYYSSRRQLPTGLKVTEIADTMGRDIVLLTFPCIEPDAPIAVSLAVRQDTGVEWVPNVTLYAATETAKIELLGGGRRWHIGSRFVMTGQKLPPKGRWAKGEEIAMPLATVGDKPATPQRRRVDLHRSGQIVRGRCANR